MKNGNPPAEIDFRPNTYVQTTVDYRVFAGNPASEKVAFSEFSADYHALSGRPSSCGMAGTSYR